MFMGPLDRDKPWSDTGIQGVRRFIDRVWRLCFSDTEGNQVIAEDKEPSESIKKELHKTIKKVTEDIEGLAFNTAISQMMILVNELYRTNEKPRTVMTTLAQLLMPFAPHMAEEIWHRLGGEGLVSVAPWPSFDPALVIEDTLSMAVQVNGKKRGLITIRLDTSEPEAMALATGENGVANALQGLKIDKVIYKPGKILNIIAK
jgi:leucyl-tRNA synthetase